MSRSIALAAFVVMAGIALFFAVRQTDRDPAESVAGQAVVDTESLDFGEAWRQPRFPWTVTLRNPSPESIELTGIETSCACTTTSLAAGTIPPGQTREVEFLLDLTKAQIEAGRGEFEVYLTFRFAEGVPPLSSALHGVVVPCPVVINGNDLDLGTIVLGTGQSTAREFDIGCPDGIALRASVPVDIPGIDVDVTDRETSRHVSISVAPDAPVGKIDFAIDLAREAAQGSPSFLRLPVQGEVVVDAQSVPEIMILGARSVGDSIAEEFTIHSRTGRWIESVEAISVPDGFAVETVQLEELPGPRAFVRITGQVLDAGTQSLEIRLAVANIEGAVCTIDVPIEYYGFE